MNCEVCGKDISFSSFKISIPVSPSGYEYHKVCEECRNAWKRETFDLFYNKFMKGGFKK